MNLISAVIITKNEAKNIDRCLASLNDIADEIVVVDSFSTDQTEEICQRFKVKFIQREFVDFSTAKNIGNEHASHPYIFSIDADEEVSETLKQSILNVKSHPMKDAYQLNRLTNYCGRWIRHCGWYPEVRMRLFKKSCAKWTGMVHETLDLKTEDIAFLKGDLLHYSYPTMNLHINKMNTYTDMLAQEMFAKGKKVGSLKLLFAPGFEFWKKYLFQRGFLDGYHGFILCMMSSYYTFFKYAKLKVLWLNKKKQD